MPAPKYLEYDAASGDIKQIAASESSAAEVIVATDPSGSLGIDLLPIDAVISIAGITIDGGGSSPATGSKGFLQILVPCTILGWTLIGDVLGSAQVTVKKGAFADPPVTASIVAAAPPALSSQQAASSSALTGWTTTIAAGEVLEFNLDSIATITRLILELKLQRT